MINVGDMIYAYGVKDHLPLLANDLIKEIRELKGE